MGVNLMKEPIFEKTYYNTITETGVGLFAISAVIIVAWFMIIMPISMIIMNDISPIEIFIGPPWARIWIVSIPISIILFGFLWPYCKGYILINTGTIQFRRGYMFKGLYMPLVTIPKKALKEIKYDPKGRKVLFQFMNNYSQMIIEVVDLRGLTKQDVNKLLEIFQKMPDIQYLVTKYEIQKDFMNT